MFKLLGGLMGLLLKDKPTIGFIGFGQTGGAIAHAIHGAFDGYAILAVESNPARQEWMRSECSYVRPVAFSELFEQCQVIFLAIKPQQVSDLAQKVLPYLQSNHCLVSMLAGVSYSSLTELFNPAQIVRIMPNTPAKLAKGVTGIYHDSNVSEQAKGLVIELCQSFGQVLMLDSDHDMDIITAMSGSGPAFFYRMVDAFVRFGVSSGLDDRIAKEAAINTMIGAGHMLLNDPNPQDQIQRVASPNGTTQAGLEMMDHQEFDTLMEKVLHRSYERAVELSKESLC